MINSSKSGPTRRQLLTGGGAMALTSLASTHGLASSSEGFPFEAGNCWNRIAGLSLLGQAGGRQLQ